MTSKRISVRIDENLHKKLERRAAVVRVDESEIVRQALTEFLSKQDVGRSAYSVFKKARLIGIVKTGPKDLSTSKKHFEGFGRNR